MRSSPGVGICRLYNCNMMISFKRCSSAVAHKYHPHCLYNQAEKGKRTCPETCPWFHCQGSDVHPLQPHTCAPPAFDPLTSETPGITVAEAPLQQTGSSTRDLEGFPVHTQSRNHPKRNNWESTSSLICPGSYVLLGVQPFMWFNCLVHLFTWVWQTPFSSQPSTPCVFFPAQVPLRLTLHRRAATNYTYRLIRFM